MSDIENGANNDGAPQFNVLAQYIKDLSFENPNAPRSLAQQDQPPQISVQVNVNPRPLAEGDFEVELLLEGTAQTGDLVHFRFELNFAGVFRLRNIPENELAPVVMIEGPRLLFPFARQIIADCVRNGGFPPLLLDPVDFVGLYRQRVAQVQAEQGAQPN
jgi:preprotein translocase subunit SecB